MKAIQPFVTGRGGCHAFVPKLVSVRLIEASTYQEFRTAAGRPGRSGGGRAGSRTGRSHEAGNREDIRGHRVGVNAAVGPGAAGQAGVPLYEVGFAAAGVISPVLPSGRSPCCRRRCRRSRPAPPAGAGVPHGAAVAARLITAAGVRGLTGGRGEVERSVAAGAALPSAAANSWVSRSAGTGVGCFGKRTPQNQVREPKMSVKKRTATVAAGASRRSH